MDVLNVDSAYYILPINEPSPPNGTHLNILVTGGAGFIGSHACKALAKSGYLPIAYDNLSRGHREAVKWGPLEVGDIADTKRLRAVLEQYRPVAVMHFAAYAYVAVSYTHLTLPTIYSV